MGQRTGIEWTDATWNPVTGCTKVSAGCDHCYAAALAERRLRSVYLARPPVVDSPANRAEPFAVRLWPERLGQPAAWREPRMVCVNSMSDLFHVDVPEAYIRRVFEVMLAVDRHVYQVLTKRPSRAARFCGDTRTSSPVGRSPRTSRAGVYRSFSVPGSLRPYRTCEGLEERRQA